MRLVVEHVFQRGGRLEICKVSIHALARRATWLSLLSAIECTPATFQSTPSRGGRRSPTPPPIGHSARRFNPRPRAEGDVQTARLARLFRSFQSTPSRGGRRCRREPTACRRFQSTPSRGGRRSTRPSMQVDCGIRFNPRPRAEGDLIRRAFAQRSPGFNPRPRAEGDDISPRQRAPTMFQSTPSRGGRRESLAADCRNSQVSIHALARRATWVAIPRLASSVSFNPRPRAEGDVGRYRSNGRQPWFQSTPSRGGRRANGGAQTDGEDVFNPRPRAEGD